MALAVLVAATSGLIYWTERLRRRLGWRWLRIVTWVLALGFLDAVVGTTLGLIRAFNSVAGVDPSMKATRLAEGISASMWSTAIQLGVMLASLVLLIALQIVASTRARR